MPDEISHLKEEISRLRKTLARLTPPIETILKRKGITVYKKNPSDDLILPKKPLIEDYFELMKKYSFRLFLRDVIKKQDAFSEQDVTRYCTAEVTGEYIEYLLEVKLAERIPEKIGHFRLKKTPIKSFGPTLEWFVARILEREFGAEVMWGVRLKGLKAGGDYDVLAKIDGSVMCVEVKSSPPKQIFASEIKGFLDRIDGLRPSISVFFMDTELRMKDKIVPMFEEELKNRHESPPPVLRMEKELFQIHDKIFIINAKDSVTANISKVLGRYYKGES